MSSETDVLRPPCRAWFYAWWWFSLLGSSGLALDRGSPHTNPILWLAALGFLAAHGWLFIACIVFMGKATHQSVGARALALAIVMTITYARIFH